MTDAATAAVVVAVAAGAFAQAISGLGFSLVAAPIAVAALGARDGVRLCVLLSIALNAVLLARDPRGVRWRPVALILVTAVLGAVATEAVADGLSGDATSLAAGIAIVVGVVLLASGRRAVRLRGAGGAAVAGVAAGAMNVLASVAGPPVVLWAGNREWPARTTRTSLQAFFGPLNLVTVILLGLPEVSAVVLASCAVALAMGSAVGIAAAARIAEPFARRVTLAVAGVGGAALAIGAVVGLVT